MLLRFLLACFVVLMMGCRSQGPPPSAATTSAAEPIQADKTRPQLIGTWKSLWSEEHKLTGALASAPAVPETDTSILIFDGVGHWANTNLPLSTLKSNRIDQLTADEAREVFTRTAPNRSAVSYFGTYTAFGPEVPDRLVDTYLEGGIDPSATGPGKDHLRLFEFVGNRFHFKLLPLTRPDQMTWRVFERVPTLTQLTPTHRRLIGFWKPLSTERQKANGEILSSTPIEVGYIVYTSSGYVQFHLQQPNRKKWAASDPCALCRGAERGPTPAEAKATLESYTGYAGPYTVDEAKGLVTHHGVGPISGQTGSDAQHSYEFSGGRLILKSPPQMIDGQQVRTVMTAERVSGDNPSDQP